MRAEIFRATFGELANRNAARIGSDDRAWTTKLFDALVEFPFDVQILNDRLDDEVTIFQLRQIVLEIADRDERCQI